MDIEKYIWDYMTNTRIIIKLVNFYANVSFLDKKLYKRIKQKNKIPTLCLVARKLTYNIKKVIPPT